MEIRRSGTLRVSPEKAFVSRPRKGQIVMKGRKGIEAVRGGTGPRTTGTINAQDIYSGSRAFLVGVKNYDNQHFLPLDLVARDLAAMDAALQKFENFFSEVKTDERVILYFSMRGF